MRRSQARYLSTILAVLVIAAGCGRGSSHGVTIRIDSPGNFDTVAGNVVKLAMSVSGLAIVKPDGDTSGRTGHFHVYIDGDPASPGSVIPHAATIVHSEANPVVVPGLTPGWHRLLVVAGDGAHQRLGDGAAAVNVRVVGPSVEARTVETIPAGQPAVITINVQGASLVAADGDISGATGHLHLFVDRAPTPPGEAIPKENPAIIHTAETTVSIPDLAPGAHYVWVVLGNGGHLPFEPPVEAKVSFNVA